MLPLTNRSTLTSPLAHFIERLGSVQVSLDPFPHYYLENVFPDDYYQALLANLPESTVYQNLFEVTDLKLDHFRHRDQRDLNAGWTSMLPEEIKDFWDSFNEWFLGPDLAQAVMISFHRQLEAQLGDEQSWPETLVEAQLIRHRAGYFLGPHSDLYTKLIVLLLYLAPDESALHLGTSLYRPKDPNFSCHNSTHYPFENFIRVKTVSYKPNSMLAFMRSDVSFHGLEALSEKDVTACGRDVIQYVLHDKQAREEQLRAKRLAAGRSQELSGEYGQR